MPSIQTQSEESITSKPSLSVDILSTTTNKCGELSPRFLSNGGNVTKKSEGKQKKQSSSYVQELFSKNICSICKSQPKQSFNKQYIVIFDWDDTLYPTSIITNNEKQSQPIQLLLTFGKRLYELLSYYIKMFGANNIYIITNATKYWPLRSMQMLSLIYMKQVIKDNNNEQHKLYQDINYFSAIYALISILKIKIISANYHYSDQFPNVPLIWKIKTFQAVTNQHFDFTQKPSKPLKQRERKTVYTIISIGDSDSEFVASKQAKTMLLKQYGNQNGRIFRLHRIKLQKNPSIKQMMKQFKCLMDEAYLMKIERGSITICYPQL